MSGGRIATITLLVRDYDEARDWFVERAGFALLEDSPLGATGKGDTEKRWLKVQAPGGGCALLLAHAANDEERAAIGCQAGGRVLLFLETDDFARDHERMTTAGVTFIEAPRHEPYGSVAVFRDVSGNPWDLIGPRID